MTQTLGRTAHTATMCWLIDALLLSAPNASLHAAQEAALESIELSGNLELSRLVELVSRSFDESAHRTRAPPNSDPRWRARRP